MVSFNQISWELQAFINSGAEGYFLDETLTQKISFLQEPLPPPLQVNALNGRLSFKVTHQTAHSPSSIWEPRRIGELTLHLLLQHLLDPWTPLAVLTHSISGRGFQQGVG